MTRAFRHVDTLISEAASDYECEACGSGIAKGSVHRNEYAFRRGVQTSHRLCLECGDLFDLKKDIDFLDLPDYISGLEAKVVARDVRKFKFMLRYIATVMKKSSDISDFLRSVMSEVRKNEIESKWSGSDDKYIFKSEL